MQRKAELAAVKVGTDRDSSPEEFLLDIINASRSFRPGSGLAPNYNHNPQTMELEMSMITLPNDADTLLELYNHIFQRGSEIFILSAYLTDWPGSMTNLNDNCANFKMIIGKDFGLTRKSACHSVLHWLPKRFHDNFLVASRIDGYHPKAVFWKEPSGKCFSLVGSSNLSRAAFSTNHEVNVNLPISNAVFRSIEQWVDTISSHCQPVSQDWLNYYQESDLTKPAPVQRQAPAPGHPIIDLPQPSSLSQFRELEQHLERRRSIMSNFVRNQNNILTLFERCAVGEVLNADFYQRIGQYWGVNEHSRIQGRGWERTGARSDFAEFCKSFLKIYRAREETRDDVVRDEINRLQEERVPTRKAFLSEFLCEFFPESYWIDDAPIRRYLDTISYALRDNTLETVKGRDGDRYVTISHVLRDALRQSPGYIAKNLTELDLVIWYYYRG